ncbi:ANM_HP_G0165620.mRNA.1.CDS.1 [Saccharomyces cerevisiae]|nr:ANM_HP_G0165620.mRNA.1.CDS.1 [Saccharomyces cerevisiae]CAI6920213.1 ANM_HP_G0165620.mRNA.1.CDS.1 [Saccharomyces cerevisiae]
MQKYLDRPQNWFESKMGKYCPLFQNCSIPALDEQSEPRRYYNPSNKSIPFWKRPFNFDTMPSTTNLWRKQSAVFIHTNTNTKVSENRTLLHFFVPGKHTERNRSGS